MVDWVGGKDADPSPEAALTPCVHGQGGSEVVLASTLAHFPARAVVLVDGAVPHRPNALAAPLSSVRPSRHPLNRPTRRGDPRERQRLHRG
ncbi:hypothetical protein OF83DRAFT_811085 [Amylostereum chailletii]|nr:hypothetical protein OF83DRAFT_811085 [Amylostereum chailletii]